MFALLFAFARGHCFRDSLRLRELRLVVRKDIVKTSEVVVVGAKGARTEGMIRDEVMTNRAQVRVASFSGVHANFREWVKGEVRRTLLEASALTS